MPLRRPPLIPTIAAAVVVAVTAALGVWQLGRADEKAELARQRERANVAAAIALRPGMAGAEVDGRRVAVTGTLIASRTVFIDNRTRNGVAGFHVVTPLRLAGSDAHVLVLRGWIASDPANRQHLPAVAGPAGEVTIEGLAQADLAQTFGIGREAEPGTDDRLWQQASIAKFRRWSGLALEPVVVRQLSSLPDGLERDWVEPGTGIDKHRGYAVQWFAMSLAAAVAWLWLGVLRRPGGAARP